MLTLEGEARSIGLVGVGLLQRDEGPKYAGGGGVMGLG